MDMTELVALLPLLIVGGLSVVVMLLIAFVRHHGLTCLVTCIGLLAAMLASLNTIGDGSIQVTPLLIMDDFTRVFCALMIGISLAAAWMAYTYLEASEEIREEYYILLLLAALGGCVLIASNHFASMFIGIELLSVSLFAMVGYVVHGGKSSDITLEAGVKYMIMSGVSSSFLLFGVALVYAYAGILTIDLMASPAGALLNQGYLAVGSAMIIIGLAFKLSWMPFHMWTPDVYQGAPAPVTGFLASGAKIAVFAFLIRFLIASGPDRIDLLLAGLTIMAVLSMLLGNLMALLQGNLKRLLAYSSVAHMGYMMVALIAAIKTGNISEQIAAEAIGLYMVAYALMTLLAFAVLSRLAALNSDYETGDIKRYRGLLYRSPWMATALLIAFLGLIGMPLTAGFIGKYYLIMAGVDQQLWTLLWVLIAGSALGIYYYLKVILVICKEPEDSPIEPDKQVRSGFSGALIGGLCFLVLYVGVYPEPVINWIQLALISL
jgi:NADH-quinone oxidoreductase subunit N|tara:strand:+ start:41314 stop:42786 length:1473 start_codon:yes stop_codon:yes gene_type:complete